MKPGQVWQLLRKAGFDPATATIMTAISGAESGWNAGAVGDVALENKTWGPSIGLFQIRTQKAAAGKGGPRDATQLRGNPLAQAKAAHAIFKSQGLGAWTTYKNGAYQKFMTQAAVGAGNASGMTYAGLHPHHPGHIRLGGPTSMAPPTQTPVPTGPGGPVQLVPGAGTVAGATVAPAFSLNGGGLFNPLNWPGALLGSAGDAAGGVAGDAAGALWSDVQPFLLTSMFVVAGLGLVVIGVTVTAWPTVKAAGDKVSEQVDQAKQGAATAAELGAVVA